jgi:hypothetical protein
MSTSWCGLSIEFLQQIAATHGVEVEWREYDYDPVTGAPPPERPTIPRRPWR